MALNQVGVNSLLAVNQWIGLINSNLQGASRTAYKTSRISFSDGLGINSVTSDKLLPPATMTVQATTIEWDQGTIINSTSQTHFAIQGEGFFVLHDPNSGKYYLTRDGEFHWSNGYLVNSSGLRVVSSGQDYIRRSNDDASDIFSPDGYSRDLAHYGDKSFLLIDVLNRNNLRMSQYGSTVFELDGNLTTRLDNNFDTTADGVTFVYDDPSIIPVVNDPGFVNQPPGALTNFTIDFGANGVFDYQAVAGAAFDTRPSGVTGTGTTIQQIINAINTFGAGNVVASYDSARDLLTIQNRVASGANNQIVFGGPNGNAVAKFFHISGSSGVNDALTTPTNDTVIITSSSDIDNSSKVPYKDIDYPGFAGPPVYAPKPLATTTIGDLINATPTYTHVKGNGTGYLEANAISQVNGVQTGASMILGESATTDQFDLVMNIKVSDTAPGSVAPTPTQGLIIFGFGAQDAHSRNSGGFEIVYNDSTNAQTIQDGSATLTLLPGQVVLRALPKDYKETSLPVVIGGGPYDIGSISDAYGNLATNPTNRVAIRLDENQQLTFSVDGVTASWNLSGGGQSLVGHLTLRNTDNVLQLHDMHLDMKRSANAVTTGEMVAVNIPPYASVDRGEYGTRPRSSIVQNALETSNASLTEYVPMLALAQKVFSAVSKIISVYNSTIDDLNQTIR